jgi:hypothetical protein
MYTEGKVDDREWSSNKGSFMSGRAWCKVQNFDPSLGLADEGWGFVKDEKASGILDWERRHLASVSKKHGLQTVFVGTYYYWQGTPCELRMQQVARPSWYQYDGLEAPLGTFVNKNEPFAVVAEADRMMPKSAHTISNAGAGRLGGRPGMGSGEQQQQHTERHFTDHLPQHKTRGGVAFSC